MRALDEYDPGATRWGCRLSVCGIRQVTNPVARVARLFVHPIKGTSAIEVDAWDSMRSVFATTGVG